MRKMKTITVLSNEAGLKDFKRGWIARYPHQDGFFKVLLTEEQYEAMVGHEHDPFEERAKT